MACHSSGPDTLGLGCLCGTTPELIFEHASIVVIQVCTLTNSSLVAAAFLSERQ